MHFYQPELASTTRDFSFVTFKVIIRFRSPSIVYPSNKYKIRVGQIWHVKRSQKYVMMFTWSMEASLNINAVDSIHFFASNARCIRKTSRSFVASIWHVSNKFAGLSDKNKVIATHIQHANFIHIRFNEMECWLSWECWESRQKDQENHKHQP